jgi:hypothetical protein
VHAAEDKSATAKVLEALADNAFRLEQLNRSAQLLGAAEALRKAIEGPIPAYEFANYQRLVSAVKLGLGKATFAKAWAAGEEMPLDEVVQLGQGRLAATV